MIGVSPAMALLRECARPHITPVIVDRLKHLACQSRDWEGLLDLADRERMTPLLCWQLKQHCPGALPTGVLSRLEVIFQDQAQCNLILTAEMFRVLRLFATHDLPACVFKGPVLACLAYGDLALRSFVDVDLLVQEGKVKPACLCLAQLGYQPQFQLSERQQDRFIRERHQLAFHHPEKFTHMELHWSILPRGFSFSASPAMIWDRLGPVALGNRTVTTLSREHTLLLLCAHGAKHNWSGLGWIADVAAFLSRCPDLDWDYLKAQAGQLGSRRMFGLGLWLPHHLLDAPVPAAIMALLAKDHQIVSLGKEITTRFINLEAGKNCPASPHRIYLKTMERRQDRVHYWIDTILIPTPLEWALVTLPHWLNALYYPIRLLRLAVKHLLRLKS